MLKNFKPVGLLLLAGTLSVPGFVSADTVTAMPKTSISQQNGKVTGTVEDEFGPVAEQLMDQLPTWTVILHWKE